MLLVFSTAAASTDFKIGVIVEENLISADFISMTFLRLACEIFPSQTLSYQVIESSSRQITNAIKLVCSESGYSGLISVGGCGLIDEINRFSASLQIPHIGLPSFPCPFPPSTDFSVIGSFSLQNLLEAAAEVHSYRRATVVAIYFDDHQSLSAIEYLQSRLTILGIRTLTFQVDVTRDKNSSLDLFDQLNRSIKKQVHDVIILADPVNVKKILQQAKTARVLQQNYYWSVIDTGMTQRDVIDVVPGNSNVCIVRGAQFESRLLDTCPNSVSNQFHNLVTTNAKEIDVRFVDIVAALAKALNDSLNIQDFHSSNASCTFNRSWAFGQTVYENLLKINNYVTQRGVVSFDPRTKHLDSGNIEVVSTFNQRTDSPTSMKLSAIYNTTSKHLQPQIKLKNRNFVFANSFSGFKNETLIICAPPYERYTHYKKLYNNESAEATGMVIDLLDFLSKMLDFSYSLKEPDDGKWGGPLNGSTIYSGCVGEVQSGVAHLGAGPFMKTKSRDLVIDFSFPLSEEATALALPIPRRQSKYWNVFAPFRYHVWLMVAIFVLLSAVFTFLLAYFSPFTAWNLQLPFAVADEIWFQEYLLSIVGSFLQQGQDMYPCAMSPRSLQAFWWMFTFIMFGAFCGDLTAHLSTVATLSRIRNLEEFVSQTDIRPAVLVGTAIHSIIMAAETETYRKTKDMMIEISEDTCLQDYLLKGGYACMSDYSYTKFFAEKNCGSMYIAEEVFNPSTVGFLYPEDAYFTEAFDFYLQKLHEAGIIQQLYKRYSLLHTTCLNGAAAEAGTIDLEGVGGVLIATGGLYFLGFLLLLVELALTKLCSQNS